MYPDSPHLTDEPTMTDLRGVLPGQRPPIDATVLDEPTSEVPLIRPGGPAVETEPAPEPAEEPAAATEPAEQPTAATAEVVPEATTDVEVGSETEAETGTVTDERVAEAVASAVAETVAKAVAEIDAEIDAEIHAAEVAGTEPAGEAGVDAITAAEAAIGAAEAEAGTGTDTTTAEGEAEIEMMETGNGAPQPREPEAAAGAASTPPILPATTPPVVAGFPAAPGSPLDGPVVPEPRGPVSEMSKLAWTPAPPPGLVARTSTEVGPTVPAAERTDLTEPAGPAEPTDLTEPADLAATDFAEPTNLAEPTDLAEPASALEPAVEPSTAQSSFPGPTATWPAWSADPTVAETAEPTAAEPTAAGPAEVPAAPATPARRPGEVAETAIALWADDAAERLRSRWHDLQVQFIDDPNAAVTGAKDLVTDAVRDLADTLLAAQDELDPFRENDQVDTESMRVAMRRYREFLERVLAL